jgi:GDPmannose 4,6-dehydratase
MPTSKPYRSLRHGTAVALQTAEALGMTMLCEGGNEVVYWNDKPVVRIVPCNFRPTEVDYLLSDPSNA